jgi:hypothetical protein
MSGTFEDARRSITGEKLSESDVDDLISSISKLRGQEAVSASQKAISQIQTLVQEGSISKSSAVSLLDDAESRLAKARPQESSPGGSVSFPRRSPAPSDLDQVEKQTNFQDIRSLIAADEKAAAKQDQTAQKLDLSVEALTKMAEKVTGVTQQQSKSFSGLSSATDKLRQSAAALSDAAGKISNAVISADGQPSAGEVAGQNTTAPAVTPDQFSNPVSNAVVSFSDKTPININVDGARMRAQADTDQTKGFQRQIATQNLKEGGRRLR